MEDHMKMNEDLGQDIPLAESTNATIEMMQEPEICVEAGMEADTIVDELGSVLGKYEVPMGLMNKVIATVERILLSPRCLKTYHLILILAYDAYGVSVLGVHY